MEDAWLLESDVETTAEIPFKLLDFLSTDGAEVSFAMKEQNLPFEVELDYTGGDTGTLIARRGGSSERMKELTRGYTGTLTAKENDRQIEANFVVRLCREGLYLDFDLEHGEESERAEIKCYPDENGEMPVNRVGVGVAVWDETIKRIRMTPPSELTVECEDEKSIGAKIGLVWTQTGKTAVGHKMTDEKLDLWEVKAKKLLPYLDPVPVTLHASCVHDGKEFEEEFNVSLMPDVSAYFDEYEKQFNTLWNLVDASFSPNSRANTIAN